MPQSILENWSACQQILEGHEKSIQSLCFTPDGSCLVSSSSDGTLRFWQTESGACEQVVQVQVQHSWPWLVSTLSPDGRVLVTACRSGLQFRTRKHGIWELEQTDEAGSFQRPSIHFSPNSKQFVLHYKHRGDISVWHHDEGKWEHQQTITVGRGLLCLTFPSLPEGNQLAILYSDGTIQIQHFGAEYMDHTRILHGEWFGPCLEAAISPDGTRVAVYFYDGLWQLWCTEEGTWEGELRTGFDLQAEYSKAAFSPDSKYLAIYRSNYGTQIWCVNARVCVQRLEDRGVPICDLTFSPDGHYLATGSVEGEVRIWRLGGRSSVQPQVEQATDERHNIRELAFSPDGKLLATITSKINAVRIWRTETGVCEKILLGHTGTIYSVAFSSDGFHLASAGEENTIRIWNTLTGTCDQLLQGHTTSILSVDFSSKHLASAGYDKTVKIWRVDTWVCELTLEGHTGYIIALAFSPNAARLASYSHDRTIRIWCVTSGTCERVLRVNTPRMRRLDLIFSPDSTHLTASETPSMWIWNIEDEALEPRKIHMNYFMDQTITFSADSTCVRTARGNIEPISAVAPRQIIPGLYLEEPDFQWVMWNEMPVLWLPMDYRSFLIRSSVKASAIASSMTAGHDQHGTPLVLVFDPETLDAFVRSRELDDNSFDFPGSLSI
jgi:WD40 repeat protein